MNTLHRFWWALRSKQRAAAAQRTCQRLRKKALSVFQRTPAPYKLNVGCGTVHFPGWINLDGDEDYAHPDILWNLADGLPTPDASCRLIYSEHVVEHLPVVIGLRFFQECHRSLVPGGILRIAMPSLDVVLEKAVSPDWRDQAWLKRPEYAFIRTRAEMLNVAFRWWDHQWLYDREELHRRLKEAGFEQLKDVEHGQSEEPEFRNRETRLDSLLIVEARRDEGK